MRALSGLGSPLESGADAASAMALRPRPGRAAEVIGEAGGGRRVCHGDVGPAEGRSSLRRILDRDLSAMSLPPSARCNQDEGSAPPHLHVIIVMADEKARLGWASAVPRARTRSAEPLGPALAGRACFAA